MRTANPHIARAEILLGQHRYDLAEPELRQALALDPDNARSHSYLAICLRELEQYTDATMEARLAVGLAPEDAETHYVLSTVFGERQMPEEAMRAIEESLRLDPADPRYWGQRAALHHDAKRYRAALADAERGLNLDPESQMCTNLRAMALRGLGQKDEARDAVAAALARNPENAASHANMGWNMLHQSRPREALEHFREALRLKPDMEWARTGMVEALKARWLPYRLMLRYFLFMSRMNRRVQMFIVIGAYLGYQGLQSASKTWPAVKPFLWPAIAAYLTFAVSTWLAVPLFNLMLRCNRFGRHVLSRNQSISATAFGAAMALSAVCGIVWACTRVERWWITAVLLLPLVVAVGLTSAMTKDYRWLIQWAWAGLVLVVTLAVISLVWADPPPRSALHGLVFVGIVAVMVMGVGSVWVSNIAGWLPERKKN